MTMDQFKTKGGSLTGREERFDEFQGVPKNIGGGTAGGFGAVRDLEHKTHQSKEHARHGDYDATPNHHHHDEAGIRQPGTSTASSTSATAGGLTGSNQHHHTQGGVTGSSTAGGLTGSNQHQHADRGFAGQGNLTGSSTQGGALSSNNHHDNNLTSNRENTLPTSDTSTNNRATGDRVGTDGVIGGVHGSGKNDLAHRENEDGNLPKALTEDRSKAEPHSSLHDNHHSTEHKRHDSSVTGTNTHHKASLSDKLNPKVDSDGDGKAGFMK